MFEDSTFHQSIRHVQREPVPYFAQLKPASADVRISDSTQYQKRGKEGSGGEDDSPEQPETPPGSAVIGGEVELVMKESTKIAPKDSTQISSIIKVCLLTQTH